MLKKMSFPQCELLMAAIILIVLVTGTKFSHINSVRCDVFSAAHDLLREQIKAGKEIEINDGEIIISKIFPKSIFQYTINPFVWTRKQMSANDDLLQTCLDAKERDDNNDVVKYKEDLSTFEARFSKWEVNLEKAKESLK